MHKTKKLIYLGLLLTWIALNTGTAQTENSPEEPEVDSPVEQTSSDDENTSGTGNETSDNFRPSEDISEDLSVSFPIDI